MQLKTMSPTSALSFARALYDDQSNFARASAGGSNSIMITHGALTPASRFESDPNVPEASRYTCTARKDVLSHTPGATKTQLQFMKQLKEEQARKRAKVV